MPGPAVGAVVHVSVHLGGGSRVTRRVHGTGTDAAAVIEVDGEVAVFTSDPAQLDQLALVVASARAELVERLAGQVPLLLVDGGAA